MDIRPYHRRPSPKPQNFKDFSVDRIDLSSKEAHLPPYPLPDASGSLPDSRPLANSFFDARAAAAVQANVNWPSLMIAPDPTQPSCVFTLSSDGTKWAGLSDPNALLEFKFYGISGAPTIFVVADKCLAVMAYTDYFPEALTLPWGANLRRMVSDAILAASPGWCGTYGPDVDSFGSSTYEGNYDFNQMFLLPLVYSYFDELPDAREHLITSLLASGRIHRASIPGAYDAFTSGWTPNDWSRAGYVGLDLNVDDVPETENHVLMIATARYLTNQLLYQRDQALVHDNRRNGDPGGSRPSCMDQILGLLRNQLRDDFAEYNAKPYQEETRYALLNLASYAYDGEVRLGARMVLDYVSAHMAVSSNDLRRMVPFRRRNEDLYVQQLRQDQGFMDLSLLDTHGADPMAAQFALLAGNTRAYQQANMRVWPDDKHPAPARPWAWAITLPFAPLLTLEALSDYRLPPSIHDLFVNDLHRRFFQRIHRRRLLDEPGQQRNCDNLEIYSGSPSYLITAGGRPAEWVIPGKQGMGYYAQNLGVAMPTSFIPTGLSGGDPNLASDVIQLCQFSDKWADPSGAETYGGTENYGVAPDFACGYALYTPVWVQEDNAPGTGGEVSFVNRKAHDPPAGFFLAFHAFGGPLPAGWPDQRERLFVLMEAFDTWRHHDVSYQQFQARVMQQNPNDFAVPGEHVYTTYCGNRIHFAIWNNLEEDNHLLGSKILGIEYAAGHPDDTLSDAGNYPDQAEFVDGTSQFLSGTVLKSAGDGMVEIHNASLGTKITLDWRKSNPEHLVRIAETGDVEQAGQGYEVWVDFDWKGPSEGDFFRPFSTIATAAAAVADGGVIKIVPGTTRERPTIRADKRVRLVAPFGLARIGVR